MGKVLIKYEFLKLVKKKSTLIVMTVSLALTVILFILPAEQYQTYKEDGVIKGSEGIAYAKGQYAPLSLPLSEDYITNTIRQVQQLFQNPDNIGYDGSQQFLIGKAYWDGIAPREKLLDMIATAYDKPGEHSGYSQLPHLDTAKGAQFYQAMEAKRQALLREPVRRLSEEQKAYWTSMASKIEVPLQYGYYEGWEILISSFELLIFAILSICILIAPVFSGEYQAGTDSVILSARHGRGKLITAKIVSAFLFAALAFTLHVIAAFGLIFAAFGTDGWNLPLQIANITAPYPYTFLQAALAGIGVIYLILFAMVSLTLLLSSRMKTPYLVLVVLVPVLFIPMLLTPNGTAGAYNLILFLLPYRSAMPEFGKYISYQFGSLVFDIGSVRAILYISLTAIMLPLAGMGFKKHQVL